MKKNLGTVAAATALAATLLTGCDTGPDCAEGHTEWKYVTTWANGKPHTVMQPKYVCDRYKTEVK